MHHTPAVRCVERPCQGLSPRAALPIPFPMTLRVLACVLIGALALAVPAAVASEDLPAPIRGALAEKSPPVASVNICG